MLSRVKTWLSDVGRCFVSTGTVFYLQMEPLETVLYQFSVRKVRMKAEKNDDRI
jgi:hypothetical protein